MSLDSINCGRAISQNPTTTTPFPSLWVLLALGLSFWSLLVSPCEGLFFEAIFGAGAYAEAGSSGDGLGGSASSTSASSLTPSMPFSSSDPFTLSGSGAKDLKMCDGSCRFAMSCWLSGGQSISGSCDSVFYSCCHAVDDSGSDGHRDPQSVSGGGTQAEARKMSYLWPDLGMGVIPEVPELPDIRYGPVVNEPNCGRPKMTKRRIVGGHDAGFGTYPWQALVRIRTSRCGGALVGPRHVVTAGHCVQAILHEMKVSDDAPVGGTGAENGEMGTARAAALSSIQVFLGEYSLYNNREPLPRQGFTVDKIFLHPYYEFTPQADRYDVAVLKLNRPVRYDWHILPVCLPEKGVDPNVGNEAMVTGWGATNPNSLHRPTELQAVDVKVVEARQCEAWHKRSGIDLKVHDDMMCAGHEFGGKDACQGDSGGPLVTQSTQGNWTLVGLVSAGFSCAKAGQPGIYHKISRTADWISYVKLYL